MLKITYQLNDLTSAPRPSHSLSRISSGALWYAQVPDLWLWGPSRLQLLQPSLPLLSLEVRPPFTLTFHPKGENPALLRTFP